MTTPPVGIERRAGQRFPYLLPLSLRHPQTLVEGVGFTQDLSSRGVFFFTNTPLAEGTEIELTLRMPSEITLGDNMPVRCRGRILRIIRPNSFSDTSDPNPKIGVAVRLECYEYLTEVSAYPRVATLHPHPEEDRPTANSSARSVVG